MKASMSRKGNCYDNTSMESFCGSLRNELTRHHRYETRANAKAAIQECIEIFYNRQRRHSRLGYIAPHALLKNSAERRGLLETAVSIIDRTSQEIRTANNDGPSDIAEDLNCSGPT